MSKHSARKIAKALGIETSGAVACGCINGVFFCIQNDAFTASLTITVKELSMEQLSDIKAYAGQNKKSLLLRDLQYDAPYLHIFLDSRYAALTAKRAAGSAASLAAFLQTLGIVSACASCGKSAASPAFYGGSVAFICDECYELQKEAAGNAMEERNVTGSYLKGFLGAVTGGAIGIIPWVIFGLLGRIAALSGFIMAYTCIKMYTVFRGKIGKAMIPIVIFVLICFTVAGVFASWFVTGLQEGYLGIGGIIRFIFSDLTITGIPGDIIIGLLLAGLGAFAMLRSAFYTASGKDLRISRDASK